MLSEYMSHPWTVLRGHELLGWLEDGSYEDVLNRKTRGKSDAARLSHIGTSATRKEAIRSHDSKAIESEAHRIKGGAGQVGAGTLQDIAAALEGMGREEQLDGAEETFEQYEREYARVSEFLRTEIES